LREACLREGMGMFDTFIAKTIRYLQIKFWCQNIQKLVVFVARLGPKSEKYALQSDFLISHFLIEMQDQANRSFYACKSFILFFLMLD